MAMAPRMLDRQLIIEQERRGSPHMTCAALIATEALERFAYYSLWGNILIFLTLKPFLWPDWNATLATVLFSLVVYICAVIGGWISDAFFARHKVIAGAFVIYIIGYSLLIILAYGHWQGSHSTSIYSSAVLNTMCLIDCEESAGSGNCIVIIYITLVVIAMGVGPIKANITPLGANQVNEEGTLTLQSFFNWYYWGMQVGSVLAITIMAYIQINYNFFYGLLIPGGLLVLGAIIQLSFWRSYKVQSPEPSTAGTVLLVLIDSLRKRTRNAHKLLVGKLNKGELASASVSYTPTRLDMTKKRYGGKFEDSMVDDVRVFVRLMPIFFAFIPYWVLYFQMNSTFLLQGIHLNVPLVNSGLFDDHTFPAIWLVICNQVIIILLIPFLDKIVYPCILRRGYSIARPVFRIPIGMGFAALALLAAWMLEVKRLHQFKECFHHSNNTEEDCTIAEVIGNTSFNAVNLTVWWQVPQYTLMGVSEVLASVTGLEFAYTESPVSMHGMIMGIFLGDSGIGALVSGLLIVYAKESGWFCQEATTDKMSRDEKCDINFGSLDNFFFMLFIIQLADIVLFILISSWYIKQKDRGQHGKPLYSTSCLKTTAPSLCCYLSSSSPENEALTESCMERTKSRLGLGTRAPRINENVDNSRDQSITVSLESSGSKIGIVANTWSRRLSTYRASYGSLISNPDYGVDQSSEGGQGYSDEDSSMESMERRNGEVHRLTMSRHWMHSSVEP